MNYGSVKLEDGLWRIQASPHIAMRLKRVLGKLARDIRGTLVLSATEENSRDLEWFVSRFPMDVSDRDELERLARAHDRRREATLRILNGQQVLGDLPMAITPREYQRVAAALARTTGGLLVADELGLGKTITGITVFADPALRPAVIVVPTHLQRQWKAEIERCMPTAYAHIAKTGTPYDTSRRGRNPDALILTYFKLHGWAEHISGHFPTVIFDEVQDLRRRLDGNGMPTKRWAAAALIAMYARVRVGLSATPIYNYGDEFYNVLEILSPRTLGSIEEFRNEWCTGTVSDHHPIEDPKAFGTYLRESGLMLRRTRKEVGRELPTLTKIIQPVESAKLELAGDTTDLARLILSEGVRGIDKMQASAQFDLRLRQATGIAKAKFVADFVRMLLAQGPVLLFAWHRMVYDAWKEAFKDLNPAWYTGHETPARKAAERERFLTGDTSLFIMSLRAGSGLDGLQARASQVVIGELDWSPGVVEQCIGRLHRDGQTEPVLAYYLVSDEGSDPPMVDVLDLKRQQLEGAIEPEGALSQAVTVDPHHVRKLAQAYLARRSG